MTRPRALGILGGLLTRFGINGTGAALIMIQAEPLEASGSAVQLTPEWNARVALVLVMIYAATAFAAGFGILKQRPWARVAYLTFVCGVGLFHAVFMIFLMPPTPTPWWLWLLWFGLVAGALLWGWRIVSRHFPGVVADAA